MAVRRSAAIPPVALDPAPLDPSVADAVAEPTARFPRWRAALAVPFVRNAYALVGSTLATSVLGVAFWLAASWAYATSDVGRDAALISTMLSLSSLAQLNLTNGFNRFVPTAGHRTRRLVIVGYLAAAGTAALAATVFVLGVQLWSPRLSLLQEHLPYALWFVAGTVVWTLFALQDAVLTGLGVAHWVLIENVSYGVVKLVLLVTAAALLPVLGVFASWTAPLIVAVVAINVLIFRRLLPARDHPPLEPVDARTVRHYVGFDMVGSVLMTATIGLLPVIVLAIVGPSGSAYLYMSWTIAYTLYLVSIGVGMSFVTESAREPERIIELARKTMGHALRIVVPLAVLVAIGAPLVWLAFPPDYGDHATTLLRLLVLSAIPNVVTVTYLSIVRVQRRMSAVIVASAALAAGVLGLSVLLTPVVGVTGVGIAWLVAQTLLATFLLFGELRTVWMPYLPFHVLQPVRNRRRVETSVPQRDDYERVAEVARSLEESGYEADGWAPTEADGTLGVRSVRVHDPATGRRALLRVATDAPAAQAVRNEVDALVTVRRAADLALLAVVPEPIGEGMLGAVWSLQTLPEGGSTRDALDRESVWGVDAVNRLDALYRATAEPMVVADGFLAGIEAAFDRISSLPAPALRLRVDASSLARLRTELVDTLAGRTLTVARVHGNLWPGAQQVRPDGALSGIVGWERSRVDLPAVDVMHLVGTTRALRQQRDLGAVMRGMLVDAHDDAESAMLASVPGLGELPRRAIVLLMWLRHVDQWLVTEDGSRPGSLWVSRNIHQVLESV